MNYHWTTCANCGCQISINWSARTTGVAGSVRRWSSDRSTNDGRPFVLAASSTPIQVPCVCGASLDLPEQPDAKGEDRGENMRVTLTADSAPRK